MPPPAFSSGTGNLSLETAMHTRKCQAVLAAAFLGAMLAPLACEQPAPGPDEMEPEKTKYDEDYIAALRTANQFCQAWLRGDYPTAKIMLTRRLIYEYPEQRLKDIIGGVSNPRHGAYEVFDGRKLDDNRIAFKVRVFQI